MAHTFIPEYEVTQTITAVRLPVGHEFNLYGAAASRAYTIRPSSLRFITEGDHYRVEGTGRKVLEDGGLSAVLYTVDVHTNPAHPLPDAPEWVLAILDGIR